MKLNINGKELDFVFGLGFLGELLEESNLSLEEVLIKVDKNPYKFIPLCMFVSAKYAIESKGGKCNFNKHEFTQWIESDGGLTDVNESAVKFIKGFTDSLFKNVPQEKGDTNSKKK